jgi:hypothetical protein
LAMSNLGMLAHDPAHLPYWLNATIQEVHDRRSVSRVTCHVSRVTCHVSPRPFPPHFCRRVTASFPSLFPHSVFFLALLTLC